MRALVALALLLGCSARTAGPAELSELNGRSVLEPSRLGVLSSTGETTSLPSAVVLGSPSAGRVLLYFEFPEVDASRKLVSADLVLGSSGAKRAIDVEVSRAEPARGALSSWSHQPRALYPRLPARLGERPGPERLDVTEIVKARSKRGGRLCLLVRAEPGQGEGVPVATGAAGGEAPRLELYWE